MAYRKGGLSPSAVDRGYPYQVALLAELSLGKLGAAQDEFCKKLLRSVRGHTVFFEDRHYLVHCFGQKAHADAFMAEFGGEPFNPAERGKGLNWNKWYKGQSALKR